jgi:hypothetical protein
VIAGRIGSRHRAEPEGIGFHGVDGLTRQLAREGNPMLFVPRRSPSRARRR